MRNGGEVNGPGRGYYRIRRRKPDAEGFQKFWGYIYEGPWDWQAGAWAYHYQTPAEARLAADSLVKQHGAIDVVTVGGKVISMWEDGTEFERRVRVAVDEAKAAMRAERPKSTWVGGVCPEYYKIPIPILGVEIMPFDVIDGLQLNFNLGCVVKYVLRAGKKGPKLDDLKKARNCIDREITQVEAEQRRLVPYQPISGSTSAFTALLPVAMAATPNFTR